MTRPTKPIYPDAPVVRTKRALEAIMFRKRSMMTITGERTMRLNDWQGAFDCACPDGCGTVWCRDVPMEFCPRCGARMLCS